MGISSRLKPWGLYFWARLSQSSRVIMPMSRRRFVGGTAAGLLATLPGATATATAAQPKPGAVPLIVSTWPFGKPSNEVALKVLLEGGSILDAIEQGVGLAESTSPDQ